MRFCGRSSLVVVVVLGSTAAVHAQDARIAVEIDPSVPFTGDQLVAALRERIGDAGDVRVVVHAGDGRVTIAVGDRTRAIDLVGRTGADAARLVALATLDLLGADDLPAPPPPAPPPPPAGPPAAVEIPDPDDPAVESAGTPRKNALAISLLGTTAAWSGMLATGGIDVVAPAGGHLVSVEFGAGGLVTGGFDLRCAVIRASYVARSSIFEGRIGAVLVPIIVEDGFGDTTLLPGATASARLHVDIAGPLRAVLAVGADVFATQTQYQRGPMPPVATPWLAPWAAVGLEVK